MALVPCPECQKAVSTEALACPQCAYPYPGKKPTQMETVPSKLNACPDCGSPVSKQAHACPHCGVSLLQERNGSSLGLEEGAIEETWLCPHCG
ncbi:MAG: zinc ribbon domain-containing protein, partial [Nitrospirales bacterium]